MWTSEQILALAPDPASAKAGQGLANPRKWVSHGGNPQALWGECQGSGADPYKTQIDLSEPAFKCSCPSRKFPCKHALGLFLMLGTAVGAKADDPPPWVAEWVASRGDKAAKKKEKLEKAAEGTDPVDLAAQAKRAADRLAKISAGIDDLSRWMEDLLRQGLASAAGDKRFKEAAARLVDAQAPGLGRMVRDLGELTSSGEGWQHRALRKLARLFLLVEGFKRLPSLPPDLQADIKSFVGIPLKEEELLRLASADPSAFVVADTWTVAGQRTEDDEGLTTRRSWLLGQRTGRYALLLEFTFGDQPLKSTVLRGTRFDAELLFYPGARPLRVIIKSRTGETTEARNFGGPPAEYPTFAAALEACSDALGKNPFLETFPMALANVRLIRSSDGLRALDADDRLLPLKARNAGDWSWQALALSGGHPMSLFGEWDGESLSLLSMVPPPPPASSEELIYGIG
jgi:hypothetical protein